MTFLHRTWLDRITSARQRGRFTRAGMKAYLDPGRCFIGEAQSQRGLTIADVYNVVSKDGPLRLQYLESYTEGYAGIKEHNVQEVERLYFQAHDVMAEVKRRIFVNS